jgi:hypothetical protein
VFDYLSIGRRHGWRVTPQVRNIALWKKNIRTLL